MLEGLTVAFDADDTLWHNEHAFAEAEHRFNDLVSAWASPEEAQAHLVEVERSQVATYGYGVKSFAISMVAAACDISNGEIAANQLRTIVRTADELLTMPTVMIDGALDALKTVSAKYRTMILTKGDLHHQLRRIAEVDVAKYCFDVEVVAEKDSDTYRRMLARHRIDPAEFVMVGNSIVSDVAPVLELGARAVHIPYEVTWALERATSEPPASDRWCKIDTIADLPAAIDAFA